MVTKGGANNQNQEQFPSLSIQSSALTGALTSSGLSMSTARLLGRTTASAGSIEEISIGSGLSMTAGVLTNSRVTPTLTQGNNYSLGLVRASSQYASIADGSETGLDFTGDFTVEAYIKLFTLPASTQQYGVLSRWSANNAGKAWSVLLENNSGTICYRCDVTSNGATADILRVNTTYAPNSWIHFAWVYVLSEKRFYAYMDGVSLGVSNTGAQTALQASNEACYLGSKFSSDHYMNGIIGYCRAWNVARTQAQIAANMNTQLTTATNLVGNWTLQNDYSDASGNNNTLTATNSPVFTKAVPFGAYSLT